MSALGKFQNASKKNTPNRNQSNDRGTSNDRGNDRGRSTERKNNKGSKNSKVYHNTNGGQGQGQQNGANQNKRSRSNQMQVVERIVYVDRPRAQSQGRTNGKNNQKPKPKQQQQQQRTGQPMRQQQQQQRGGQQQVTNQRPQQQRNRSASTARGASKARDSILNKIPKVGGPIEHTEKWISELPKEARNLINHYIEMRLTTKNGLTYDVSKYYAVRPTEDVVVLGKSWKKIANVIDLDKHGKMLPQITCTYAGKEETHYWPTNIMVKPISSNGSDPQVFNNLNIKRPESSMLNTYKKEQHKVLAANGKPEDEIKEIIKRDSKTYAVIAPKFTTLKQGDKIEKVLSAAQLKKRKQKEDSSQGSHTSAESRSHSVEDQRDHSQARAVSFDDTESEVEGAVGGEGAIPKPQRDKRSSSNGNRKNKGKKPDSSEA